MEENDINLPVKIQNFDDYLHIDEENNSITMPMPKHCETNIHQLKNSITFLEDNDQKIIVDLQTLLTKKEPSIFFNELLHKYPELSPKIEIKEEVLNGRKNFHIKMQISKFGIESIGKGFHKSLAKSKLNS